MERMFGTEVRLLEEGDLKERPDVFQNEEDGYATAVQIMCWCMLHPEDDENPHYAFRNMNPDSERWAGIIRTGDTVMGVQKSAHHQDIAKVGDPFTHYGKLEEGVYGMSCEDPYLSWRFGIKEGEWKEGDILDLKLEYLPFAKIAHHEAQHPFYIGQMYHYTGTYEGKPVSGFGGLDRVYKTTSYQCDWVQRWFYVISGGMGIRPDGRKELFEASLYEGNGTGTALYWLEGEEPVFTDKVTMEAVWEKLDYAPEDDHTVTYREAVWRFADKVIHVKNRWGTKGFTERPRMEKVGQSQSFGTWYEGDEPYEHTDNFSFNENSDVTIESMEELGFKVIR